VTQTSRNLTVLPRVPASSLTRVGFVVLTAVYVEVFHLTYVNDLSPLLSYLGLTYIQPSVPVLIFAWVLALIPSFMLNLAVDRPSHFILLLLYICVFIPSSFVPLFVSLSSVSDVMLLNVMMLAGFILMVLMVRGKVRPFRFRGSHGRSFWIALWALLILISIWIVAVFGSSLKLVTLSDVYSSGLRFESREIFDRSYVGFGVLMMYGALNPLVMALGLQRRDWRLILIGIAGQMLCYSTSGIKAIIFSIILVLVVHFVLRGNMHRAAHVLIGLCIALFLCAHVTSQYNRANPASLLLTAVVSRAFAIPGQLTAEYYDYFDTHPNLHLANTKPFSWFVDNPLEGDVIHVISGYYEGNPEVTSNAHFWAEDGIANFGLIGILVVSILAGAVLRIVDRVAAVHDACFTSMAFSFAGYNLCNVPLSTTLLSGGLLLMLVLMMLADRQVGVRQAFPRQRRIRSSFVHARANVCPETTK
jgi:hypothetical protein